jgi:tRNA threonylcarbamoyl adenosine modification protein (Sua5/YciO/YrdC/YwlC family)
VSPSDLEAAVEALAAGLVVAVPTDTVYGLAVDPRQAGAVERVFAVKQRPEQIPLPLLIGEPGELAGLAELSPVADRLVERYWPGPLTLVLARRPGTGFELGGDGTTVGVRCPDNPLLRELLRKTGPLAVTSANVHGEAPLHTAESIREHFGARVRVVLDGGRCEARASTVVALTPAGLRCLREGAIDLMELEALAAGG